MSQTVAILLALLLVGLNAFFVATEFAIVKVRETRLVELSRRGNRAAAVAEKVVARLDTILSATQLGITFASLGLGWVGEPAFARLFEAGLGRLPFLHHAVAQTASLTTAFLFITVLHIIFGELAPKSLAIQRPEATTLFVARPIVWFSRVFYPVIWTLNTLANMVVRWLRLSPDASEEKGHSEEELQILLTRGHAGQAVGRVRQRLLQNVFTFGRRTARQIMIPRADVAFLSVRRPFAELLSQAQSAGHTRFPVCDGELDNVLGIAHIKDLWAVREAPQADIRRLVRAPLFVPESMSAEKLLLNFQNNRQHLAIVVDEYGGASGIVTLEDVIEELVGEVQDEFDEETPQLLPVRGGGFLVGAGMLLEAVAAQLGVKPPESDAETIGGYVQFQLGEIGRVGDEVPFGDRVIRVLEMRGRRLLRLLILPPGPAATSGRGPARIVDPGRRRQAGVDPGPGPGPDAPLL